MTFIKIDKEMLVDNLYHIRSKVDLTAENSQELVKAIESLTSLIMNAPQAEIQAQFPRIRGGR